MEHINKREISWPALLTRTIAPLDCRWTTAHSRRQTARILQAPACFPFTPARAWRPLSYFFGFKYKKQFIAILIWDVRGGYRLQIYPRSYATRYMGFPIFPKLTSSSSARFRCYRLFLTEVLQHCLPSSVGVDVMSVKGDLFKCFLGSWIVSLASLRVVLPVLTEFPLISIFLMCACSSESIRDSSVLTMLTSLLTIS